MNANSANLTPKARRTRSALLEAAIVELASRGVAGITVMGVCARAGVGRTSFYNYFEDTDDLIAIVAQVTANDIKERFDRLHSDMPRGRARLKACLGMILGTAAEEPDAILLVISLSRAVPEIMELLRREISAELAAFASGSEKDRVALVHYLAHTTLALSGQVALGNLPASDVSKHVDFMMRACGRHDSGQSKRSASN